MLLNDDIADIEKADGICSPTFISNKFLGLFLHPLMLSIKYSRSAEKINMLIKFYFGIFRRH